MTERTIQIGDIAVVTVGTTSQKYTIKGFSNLGILVDNQGSDALLVLVRTGWQVKHFTPPHTIKFMPSTLLDAAELDVVLTGLDDANIMILANLDYDTIMRACATNKAYKKFCDNKHLWLTKLDREYRGAAQFISHKYGPTVNFREIYKKLIECKLDDDSDDTEFYVNDADIASGKGYLEIVAWFADIDIIPTWGGAAHAAKNGHLEVLKLIYQINGEMFNEIHGGNKGRTIADYAVAYPNILRWLYGLNPSVNITMNGFLESIDKGYLESLKLLELNAPRIVDGIRSGITLNLVQAMGGGHLEMVKYLDSRYHQMNGPQLLGTQAAAVNGHLEMLKWMYEKGYFSFMGELVNKVAAKGHLRILQWMSQLQWMPQLRLLPNHIGAENAIFFKHHNVSKWLASRNIYPITKDGNQYDIVASINNAIENGDVQLLTILGDAVERADISQMQSYIKTAIMNGHLDVIKLLHKKMKIDVMFQITIVMQYGQLEMLKLISMGGLIQSALGAHYAAINGHLDILKWIAQLNKPVLPRHECIKYVIGGGHLKVLKFLATLNPPVLPLTSDIAQAIFDGRIRILEWMSNLNPPILPVALPRIDNSSHKDIIRWATSKGLLLHDA